MFDLRRSLSILASFSLVHASINSSYRRESAFTLPPFGHLHTIAPLANLNLGIRHCTYVASFNPFEPDNTDFSFNLVASLNGNSQLVSFQSTSFPTYFLSIINTTSGTVGIVESGNVDDASWSLIAPLSPPPPDTTNAYTIVSASKGQFGGKYLTAATTTTMPCSYTSPCGDTTVTDGTIYGSARSTFIIGDLPPSPPNPEAVIFVDTSTVTNPQVNKKFMGCHHDYGFAQAPRGFYAEMIYGNCFDKGTQGVSAWSPFRINSSAPDPALTDYTAFSGKSSLGIELDHDFATLGMINRGIGNAGLVFEANQPYEASVFIWCGAGAGNEPNVYMEMVDYTQGNLSLARVDFKIVSTGPPWGTNWVQYNFTLTPSASTTCVGIPFDSDPLIDCGEDAGPAHICVRCGGEFRIGVTGTSYGGINIGFVSLMPGAWARIPKKDGSGSTVTLKSAGDVLQEMGVSLMRNGGSVSQSMRWKDWRGPAWNRPSNQQVWGYSLLSGWGPFEYAELAEALGIEAVITLAYDSNDAMDFGDLVEYLWGDATTSWGRRRAADGHPSVYTSVTTFELGNEAVNPNFVDQVLEMEARSKLVNSPPLYYMYPQNNGPSAEIAAALLSQAPDVVSRILPDLHVGAGGAVESAADLFAHPPVNGFNQGAINAETNAGTHDMKRALDEASDLIDWFTYDTTVTDRLYARTASFCSGSSNNFDQWDQGISFFLPNMTWFQPPGYVHVMITNTWAEKTIKSSFGIGNTTIPFAAQLTSDGKTLILRAVNSYSGNQPLSISISNGSAKGTTYTLWLLSGMNLNDDNTPSNPTAISPISQQVPIANGATSLSMTLPKYTFAVAVIELN
jgi:hypothetical protein